MREEGKGKRFLNFKTHPSKMNSNKDLNSNTRNNAPACMQ
jgi:hypothetical protein